MATFVKYNEKTKFNGLFFVHINYSSSGQGPGGGPVPGAGTLDKVEGGRRSEYNSVLPRSLSNRLDTEMKGREVPQVASRFHK